MSKQVLVFIATAGIILILIVLLVGLFNKKDTVIPAVDEVNVPVVVEPVVIEPVVVDPAAVDEAVKVIDGTDEEVK